MTSSQEQNFGPSDYPLPVVDTKGFSEAAEFVTADGPDAVSTNIERAFRIAQINNRIMTATVADVLQTNGYVEQEAMSAALTSVGLTHLLLHTQARINQGIAGVDMSDDRYTLPIVAETTVDAFFAGASERAIATGRTPYDDLAAQNPLIPQALSLFELPIGNGHAATRPNQAAEIAAIAAHGLLREQATIDAMNQQWGMGPLG
jgi:hypothetical protein